MVRDRDFGKTAPDGAAVCAGRATGGALFLQERVRVFETLERVCCVRQERALGGRGHFLGGVVWFG